MQVGSKRLRPVERLGDVVTGVRENKPMVHCITNYVTANDCANILLACGGSAVMADDPDETAEITRACDGLVLNIGTPNPRKLQGIICAAKAANECGHPIVLDPVGVGGSAMRRVFLLELLKDARIAVIRGNASEIRALSEGIAIGRGVESEIETMPDTGSAVVPAIRLAKRTGAVVIVSGDTDIVTDGERTYRVMNGHPMMRTITGTGCQLSALLGAYITAYPADTLKAALAGVCAMGLCGQIAHERLSELDGNASYRNYIIDAVWHLSGDTLERGAAYEVF